MDAVGHRPKSQEEKADLGLYHDLRDLALLHIVSDSVSPVKRSYLFIFPT